MMKNPLFIHVDTPIEVRRDLLEIAKSALTTLKSSAQFKQVREEKLNTAHMLKETMKELKDLNTQLRSMFPEVMAKQGKHEKQISIKKDKVRVEPLAVDKVEQLEQALHDIETKLSTLG